MQSLNKNEIFDLTFKYVTSLAKKKPYNIQMKAINNHFKNHNSIDREVYFERFHTFSKRNSVLMCRDFVYKNDLLTFRKFYIASPQLYLYYTFQVFSIYFSIFQVEQPFNESNIKVFYSGLVSKDSNIQRNSTYDQEYSKFKTERESFKNNHVYVIDIQNFFDSIDLNKLYKKLYMLVGTDVDGKLALKNLKEMFNFLEINSLPQLHHSVASSVLSQIYLMDITKFINEKLVDNNWEAVRFVDDLYINLKSNHSYKSINSFLHSLSKLMYIDKLNINTTKSSKLTPKKFIKLVEETSLDTYNQVDNVSNKYNINSPSISKIVRDKVKNLLENDGHLFLEFIKDVKYVFSTRHLDLNEYNRIIQKHISIDGEDVSKVITDLVFSKEWKILSNEQLNQILKCIELLFFDPYRFSILYCLIFDYLNKDYINKKIDYKKFALFYDSPIRLLMIFEQFTLQGQLNHHDFKIAATQLHEIDPNAYIYFKEFIFENNI